MIDERYDVHYAQLTGRSHLSSSYLNKILDGEATFSASLEMDLLEALEFLKFSLASVLQKRDPDLFESYLDEVGHQYTKITSEAASPRAEETLQELLQQISEAVVVSENTQLFSRFLSNFSFSPEHVARLLGSLFVIQDDSVFSSCLSQISTDYPTFSFRMEEAESFVSSLGRSAAKTNIYRLIELLDATKMTGHLFRAATQYLSRNCRMTDSSKLFLLAIIHDTDDDLALSFLEKFYVRNDALSIRILQDFDQEKLRAKAAELLPSVFKKLRTDCPSFSDVVLLQQLEPSKKSLENLEIDLRVEALVATPEAVSSTQDVLPPLLRLIYTNGARLSEDALSALLSLEILPSSLRKTILGLEALRLSEIDIDSHKAFGEKSMQIEEIASQGLIYSQEDYTALAAVSKKDPKNSRL